VVATTAFRIVATLAAAGAVATGCAQSSRPAPPSPAAARTSTASPIAPAGWMWISARDIPLDWIYRWPTLAASAHPVTSPLFAFEQACGSTPDPWRSDIEKLGYAAMSAPFGRGGTDWQGLQLIVRPPGTGDTSISAARGLFNLLYIELTQACATAVNGAHATVAFDGSGGAGTSSVGYRGLAATVTGGPTSELHDYLVLAHCAHGAAVSELALWASRPTHPWPAPAGAQVLDAMHAALCSGDVD
jgi:hypothetical protein